MPTVLALSVALRCLSTVLRCLRVSFPLTFAIVSIVAKYARSAASITNKENVDLKSLRDVTVLARY